VVLDLAGATAIDLAGLQLLCSAHRTSRGGPRTFELRAVPERLRNTACAAGFDARTLVCPYRGDGACLWKD
jgi:ABC-type transporter Mla MlaB component